MEDICELWLTCIITLFFVNYHDVMIMTCVYVEVLGHRRRCSQPADLPVSDSMFIHDSSTFAKEFRERFSTLKSEFDEVCLLCVSSTYYVCNLAVHKCFAWHFIDISQISDQIKAVGKAAKDFKNSTERCKETYQTTKDGDE